MIKIPNSGRKKALIVIDIQPQYITKRNRYIIKNISRLIGSVKYDLYVEAIFHADKDSLWDKQQGRIYPKKDNFFTVDEIKGLLGKNTIKIEKNRKSVFKGNKDLFKILKQNKISEIHLVGMDTNDCILASSYESFDLGFFTYAIEECCQTELFQKLHKKALDLLRYEHMTNNSVLEKINFVRLK